MISTSWHKRLAAETHLAEGEVWQVAVNREGLLQLSGRTRIPMISKRECNNHNNNNKHWCEHVPISVETSQGGKVTILWNQQVQIDRTILNNKPDILIRDNEKGTCMLIDVAISGDRNVIKNKPRRF